MEYLNWDEPWLTHSPAWWWVVSCDGVQLLSVYKKYRFPPMLISATVPVACFEWQIYLGLSHLSDRPVMGNHTWLTFDGQSRRFLSLTKPASLSKPKTNLLRLGCIVAINRCWRYNYRSNLMSDVLGYFMSKETSDESINMEQFPLCDIYPYICLNISSSSMSAVYQHDRALAGVQKRH